MAKLFCCVCVCLLAVGVLSTVLAGPNAGFKVAVHVQEHNANQRCSALPAISDCGDIQTTYEGNNLDFFPVFYDLVDYRTFAYGVSWPAAWGSCAFSDCSDAAIGTIRSSGDDVVHIYSPCRPGPVAVPGWGWLYASSPGVVCLVDHLGESFWMSGCDYEGDLATCNFCAGVNGAYGDDPCGPSATEPSTWGEIKRLFED